MNDLQQLRAALDAFIAKAEEFGLEVKESDRVETTNLTVMTEIMDRLMRLEHSIQN